MLSRKTNKVLKVAFLCFCLLISSLWLVACSGGNKSFKDGEYSAESDYTDPQGGYGQVSLTIKEGKIQDVDFQTFNADGSVKDETYGQDAPEAEYRIAQLCVEQCDAYAQDLEEEQDLEMVDLISGATWNYDIFKSAVGKILEEAAPRSE